MIKSRKDFFIFSKFISGRPFPVPRRKSLSPRDLKNGKDLNNQTLWDDRPVYVDVFKLFCFVRRNFRSSPEALQK
jgi:hypothetical protein